MPRVIVIITITISLCATCCRAASTNFEDLTAAMQYAVSDAFQLIVFRPTGPKEFLLRSVTVLARLHATCGDISSLQADAESPRAFHTKP